MMMMMMMVLFCWARRVCEVIKAFIWALRDCNPGNTVSTSIKSVLWIVSQECRPIKVKPTGLRNLFWKSYDWWWQSLCWHLIHIGYVANRCYIISVYSTRCRGGVCNWQVAADKSQSSWWAENWNRRLEIGHMHRPHFLSVLSTLCWVLFLAMITSFWIFFHISPFSSRSFW